MLILHANWHQNALHLWAEALDAFVDAPHGKTDHPTDQPTHRASPSTASPRDAVAVQRPPIADQQSTHPYVIETQQVAESLTAHLRESRFAQTEALAADVLHLLLPSDIDGPRPSERLASMASGAHTDAADAWLKAWRVPTLRVDPGRVFDVALALEETGPSEAIDFGHSLRYWLAVVRFGLDLLIDQRFIPSLIRTGDDQLRGMWLPWLDDPPTRRRAAALVEAMPPVGRACVHDETDDAPPEPAVIVQNALNAILDHTVRAALSAADFHEAIEDRDSKADPHVAWLSGLLARNDVIDVPHEMSVNLLRDAAQWINRLVDVRSDQPMRLALEVREPTEAPLLDDLAPTNDLTWRLRFHLAMEDNGEQRLIDAQHIWSQAGSAGLMHGSAEGAANTTNPQELLLTELARAARLCPMIEPVLNETAPSEMDLTTTQAHEFLREHMPVLNESGIHVIAPSWWDEPAAQLGARLHIDAPAMDDVFNDQNVSAHAQPLVGLNSLVECRWELTAGEQSITFEQLEQIAAQNVPFVRLAGRWVEVRPEDVRRLRTFISKRGEQQMTLLEALRTAYGEGADPINVPVFGVEATGWVNDLLNATTSREHMPVVDQPRGFNGSLRPYQRIGLSWLAFLDRFGLGACLADDMGLGKTIQLIALLQHERENLPEQQKIGPTLLLVPTSVLGNWQRELRRFAPEIKVLVHHGADRPSAEAFEAIARDVDVVLTTYGLATRDRDTLNQLRWWRITLDEAQYIKNTPTKLTQSIRSFETERRLTLTGTPVENRLSELWSIMEFCNPGYLGSAEQFRREFAIPIERHRDQRKMATLRGLIQPFVLRRLKSDPHVIDDLPPLVQTREFATLTGEQARLYEQTVNSMLREVEQSEGMQRRGLVLATLTRLKQICNHPAQLNGNTSSDDQPADAVHLLRSERSGKCQRLITLLEEVLATGERALVFTQFRKMGDLLTTMLRHKFDCDVLFLHGGTPQSKRQQMIDHFQSPEGEAPIFVLSLKAGGLGLNLTAANHVFHFDRWWNPAVETQATDRAFRIGQTRIVHVHKFVCEGTLEERIDQMIEQKTELAQNIIGSGEQWLTELNTAQLRDLLTLRNADVEGES